MVVQYCALMSVKQSSLVDQAISQWKKAFPHVPSKVEVIAR